MGMRREEKWRPDRISAPEASEIRRGSREGLSGKSKRGVDLPTQDGEPAELPGRYPPPKPTPRPGGSWRHRKEAREIRRGRRKGPSGRNRREEEGVCPTHSTQEACWAPR